MKLAAQVENTDSPAADFKKTIHSLLLRTDEQLEALSKATEASDLPTMAYATRNLLELMVWSVYVLKSNDNTKRFAQDWVLDGIGILEILDGWSVAQGGDAGESIRRTLEQLRKHQAEWRLGKDYLRIATISSPRRSCAGSPATGPS